MRYQETHFKGKPAIWDSEDKIYWTGFNTMKAARDRCKQLNNKTQENQ